MSAEIVDASRGVLTIRIAGELTQAELAAVQRQAGETLRRDGKMGILILTENFRGWGPGGDAWGDLSFQEQHDPLIDKLAIVGDQKWEDLALIFVAKGLRRFPVEYFSPAELTRARAWLIADQDR